MKKVFFLLFALLILCNSVYAQKDEYISKDFDFTKPKKIFFTLEYNFAPNGIRENETATLLMDAIRKNLGPLRESKGVVLSSYSNAAEEMKEQLNYDFINDPDEAASWKKLEQFVTENYDMVVHTHIITYDTGTQYREGYFLTLPSSQISTFNANLGMNGSGIGNINGTVITDGTRQQYVPGGNVPISYCCVQFQVITPSNNNAEWTRIDDRAKALTGFSNTKPKDLYQRILDSFYQDLAKKLEGKKA